jgi:hypothetical protein
MYFRTVKPLLLFCFGTFDLTLVGLGRNREYAAFGSAQITQKLVSNPFNKANEKG